MSAQPFQLDLARYELQAGDRVIRLESRPVRFKGRRADPRVRGRRVGSVDGGGRETAVTN